MVARMDMPPHARAGQIERGHLCADDDRADLGVGDILAALDQRGLTNNTLVVFTNDNAPAFDVTRFFALTTLSGGRRISQLLSPS